MGLGREVVKGGGRVVKACGKTVMNNWRVFKGWKIVKGSWRVVKGG